MKMLVAAIAVAALGFPPAAAADCGPDHAAQSASATPAPAPDRDAKAPAASDRTIASKTTVKQKVAKVKSTPTDPQQKIAANTPK